MKKRSFLGVVIYVMILGAILTWVLGLFDLNTSDISYSGIIDLFQKEQVKSFVVQDNTIHLELYEPYEGKQEIAATMADTESFRQEMSQVFQQQ